jgi:hypothetical protein
MLSRNTIACQEAARVNKLLPLGERLRRRAAALLLNGWLEQPGFWHERFHQAMCAEEGEGSADFRMRGERCVR